MKKTLVFGTRKIHSDNAEFSIEEGCWKGCFQSLCYVKMFAEKANFLLLSIFQRFWYLKNNFTTLKIQ